MGQRGLLSEITLGIPYAFICISRIMSEGIWGGVRVDKKWSAHQGAYTDGQLLRVIF